MKNLFALLLACSLFPANAQDSVLKPDASLAIPKVNFDANGNIVMLASPSSSSHDFDFLIGKWKLKHRKLKSRMTNSDEWLEFETIVEDFGILAGSGNMDIGHGTIDGKPWEGRTLRVFDPKTRLWSLHWMASNFATVDPPVVGSFENGVGHFFCKDTYNGKNIIVMFRWDSRNKDRSVWSQAFSADNGKTWEWNWFNVKEGIPEQSLKATARANFAIPVPKISFDAKGDPVIVPSPASSHNDFDFLLGRRTLRHRRMNTPKEWVEFVTVADEFKILEGAGNMNAAYDTIDGKAWEQRSVRMYDPETRLWSLYSVASDIGVVEPPVVGSFENGLGHFFASGILEGRKIIRVVRWDSRDEDNPVGSQGFSADSGKTWEWIWITESRKSR